MSSKPTYTARPMPKQILFHAPVPLVDLLRLAASQQEVSCAAFIRAAIKEKAVRVLGGIDVAPAESANAPREVTGILASEAGSVLSLRGAPKKDSK